MRRTSRRTDPRPTTSWYAPLSSVSVEAPVSATRTTATWSGRPEIVSVTTPVTSVVASTAPCWAAARATGAAAAQARSKRRVGDMVTNSTPPGGAAHALMVPFHFLVVVPAVVVVVLERVHRAADVGGDHRRTRRVGRVEHGAARILEPARDVHLHRDIGRARPDGHRGLEARLDTRVDVGGEGERMSLIVGVRVHARDLHGIDLRLDAAVRAGGNEGIENHLRRSIYRQVHEGGTDAQLRAVVVPFLLGLRGVFHVAGAAAAPGQLDPLERGLRLGEREGVGSAADLDGGERRPHGKRRARAGGRDGQTDWSRHVDARVTASGE